MGIIEQSLAVKKTIKNISRLKEILSVLSKNGLSDLLTKAGFGAYVAKGFQTRPPSEGGWSHWFGNSLHRSFESLGPSFVKAGQLLASREDIFDDEFIDALSNLRDQVSPMPFEEAREIMAKQWGQDPEKVFKQFNPTPIGCASISVVYEAITFANEEVVVKIRRPGIKETIKQDLDILFFIIKKLEAMSIEVSILGLSRIVQDIRQSLLTELDFTIEKGHLLFAKSLIEAFDDHHILAVPSVHEELSSDEILVMEKLKGQPLSQRKPKNDEPLLGTRLQEALEILFRIMLKHGFYHSDLHAGNLFLLSDSRIGLIDFGACGVVSKKASLSLLAVFAHFLDDDYENLTYELLDISEYEKIPPLEELTHNLRISLAKLRHRSLKDLEMGRLILKIMTILGRSKIFLPRDWLMMARAIVTMEGLIKSQELSLDPMVLIKKSIDDFPFKSRLWQSAGKESMILSRQYFSLIQFLPRYIRWYLKDSVKKGFTFEHSLKGIGELSHSLQIGLFAISLMILASAALLGLSFLFKTENPFQGERSLLAWAMAALLLSSLGLWGFLFFSRRKKE